MSRQQRLGLHPCWAMQRRNVSGRAFSLVELLVVIAIVVMLISLLMPTLAKSREAARASICLSNLRGLGSAFILYATSARGYVPPQTLNHAQDDATYKLAPYQSYPYSFSYVQPMARLAYMGLIPHVTVEAGDRGNAAHIWNRESSIRLCPTTVQFAPNKLEQPFLGDNFSHYIADLYVVGRYHNTSLPLGDPAAWSPVAITRRINSIRKPAQVMALADGRYWVRTNTWPQNQIETTSFMGLSTPNVPGTNCAGDKGSYLYEAATTTLQGFRHRDAGCNFVFIDGHGEFRRWQGNRANWKTSVGYGQYLWSQQ